MKGVAEQPDDAQDEQEYDETDFEHGGPFEGAFGWGHLDESGEGLWGEGGEAGRCWGIYEGDKFWGGRAQLIDLRWTGRGVGTLHGCFTRFQH